MTAMLIKEKKILAVIMAACLASAGQIAWAQGEVVKCLDSDNRTYFAQSCKENEETEQVTLKEITLLDPVTSNPIDGFTDTYADMVQLLLSPFK